MGNKTPTNNQLGLSRRQLLTRLGWVAGGVTLLSACNRIPALPTFASTSAADSFTWLQLQPDGRFLFYCPRTEMGQGIASGLQALIAEELNVPLSNVNCRYPRTDQIPPTALTVGSQSMERFYQPSLELAANLRETLRARLAEQTQTKVRDIELIVGGFKDSTGNSISYRDLLAPREDTVLAAEILGDQATDSPHLLSQDPVHQNQYIGQFVSDHEIGNLVTGRTQFSSDVRLPNLHYGLIARPPFLGAELLGCNNLALLPNGAQQIRGPNGELGVIAPTPMAAAEALTKVEPRWSAPSATQTLAFNQGFDVDAAIVADAFDHQPIHSGDINKGSAAAVEPLSFRYDSAMTAHAAMEPRAGCARVTNDIIEIWTGSQDPWLVRSYAAHLLRWPEDKVIVHNHRLGGAFGGRALCQASIEAAWLAAASKVPVKVQWSRSEELRFNYVGPAFSHRINCGVTTTGEISHWQHQMLGAPILTSSAMIPHELQTLADVPADPGTQRGTELAYHCQNQELNFADVRGFMPTGPWRGLGAGPNTFAVESAIDELANAAQSDPLTFRLQQMRDQRLIDVTKTIAKRCAWDRPRPPQSALGIAVSAYKGVTYVAVVAEVSVRNNEPTLTRLWCVQDCGRVVVPDQVRAQVEGNLVWGVSMARHERFETKDGLGLPSNFHEYPIARALDIPIMDIQLAESNQAPSGAGEAALAPTAAAIANAYAKATGQRQRQLPFEFNVAPQT